MLGIDGYMILEEVWDTIRRWISSLTVFEQKATAFLRRRLRELLYVGEGIQSRSILKNSPYFCSHRDRNQLGNTTSFCCKKPTCTAWGGSSLTLLEAQ
jgi:hypothetical protein